MTQDHQVIYQLGRFLQTAHMRVTEAEIFVRLNDALSLRNAPQATEDAMTSLDRSIGLIQDAPLPPGIQEGLAGRIRSIKHDIRDLGIPVLPNDDRQGRRDLDRNLKSIAGDILDVIMDIHDILPDVPD